MTWMRTCVAAVALGCFFAFAPMPIGGADTPGEAFCAEIQHRLDGSNGEMPFEIDEAVAWLTQRFNMSETEAVRLMDDVGETYWSGMNGRWEVRCHGQ
ncbi:hypothetical protein A5762_04220 [Mycolicibacterium elephantis]|nr:hypothetical protein A5762_04220 [Mycolicibacterium elephantis]